LLEKMQDAKDEVYEEIETISSKGESSVIAKAKITLGARFFSILKANADFESAYKVNDEMRKDARKFFKLRRNELIELINSIILSYKMEQNNGKELAIIIDDLEKSKNIDELYMEDMNILERLNLLKIISMPIYLKRNNTFSTFDVREFALKLKKRDQTPNEKDLALLRKVIDFRVENKTLISKKAVNLAIDYSGTNLRQLIKLVHFAAEYALAFESAEIGEKEMLDAIERVGRDFSEQARHMSSFLLEISEHKWYVEESEENRAKLAKATDNVIELRKNSQALVILGADTKELAGELQSYFEDNKQIKNYKYETANILFELTTQPKEPTYLVNIYEAENIDAILEKLQFGRDFIPQFGIKFVVIVDKRSYEILRDRYYDFFSVNSFAYLFTDHSCKFDRTQINGNGKLEEKLREYDEYTHNTPHRSVLIEIEALIAIANEAYSASKLDMALEHYNMALNLCEEEKHDYYKAVILGGIGLIYQTKGDLVDAMRSHKEALRISEEMAYLRGVADQLDSIGAIYQVSGDLKSALRSHEEALRIYKEIRYLQGTASAMANIGMIYKARGSFEEALKSFEEALMIDREYGYARGVARDLDNIGTAYCDLGKSGEALKSHKMALEIWSKAGDLRGAVKALSNIATLYEAFDDDEIAKAYRSEAAQIKKELGADI